MGNDKNNKKRSEKKHELDYYLVLFLDILGQRGKIRSLKGLPINKKQRVKALNILSKSYGVMWKLREMFDAHSKMSKGSKIIEHLIPKQRFLKGELNKTNIIYNYFSDSVIISVKLDDIDYYCTTVNSIYSVLYGACWVMLGMLALGHPVRGGIDVGWGINSRP